MIDADEMDNRSTAHIGETSLAWRKESGIACQPDRLHSIA